MMKMGAIAEISQVMKQLLKCIVCRMAALPVCLGAAPLFLTAQQVNVGLYATAVPDSFEVRVFSDGPEVVSVVTGAVFTVRWEASAGGEFDANDILNTCSEPPQILNVVQEESGYRYVSFFLLELRPLGVECSITTQGRALFGFRIRELSGCRHVGLVSNAYTDLNNTSYYFAATGGIGTGMILTDPIASGDCPPCEPPVIADAGADSVPYCGNGVNLWVEASGTLPDLAWYRPNGSLLSWQPQVYSPTDPAGLYTVVASNACGADTAQVEAVVDTSLCVPPAIDSAWFNPAYWGTAIHYYQLHAAASGSCLGYEWTMPWGESMQAPGLLTFVTVPNPIEGNYTLVVSNACGSDTAVIFMTPPGPCEGPALGPASITAENLCQTGAAVFDVPISGSGPMITRWYGPNGQLITGSPNFTLPYAPWGTYTFVASNYCRTDTLTLFHGPADTTGLAACEPPQVLSLSAIPVACYGDTVNIVASVALPGPCATLEWSNVQVLSTFGDTVFGRLTSDHPPTLTATNACGQVVAQAPIELIRPLMYDRNLCRISEPLSLDSLVVPLGMPYSGGQWRLAGTDHGLYYDPAVDTSGIFQYFLDTLGVYCSVVDFGLHEFPGVYAGEDSSVTVCSSDPPFPLFGMLGGQPETGGTWRYGNMAASSTFDPAVNAPGVYRYNIQTFASGGGCTDFALVTVAVDTASTWYADADGDGLGDPADSLLACEQPLDHVAVAGDECPEIFGTVGDPCDDGDPHTFNDVLGEDCACAGEPDMGIAEVGGQGFSLWPNPNGGDRIFLQVPVGAGKVDVEVADPAGRVVLRKTLVASSAPAPVDLPAGLVGGNYFVSMVADRAVAVRRLVVVR